MCEKKTIQDGFSLYYAEAFKSDRPIVLAAVKQAGEALEYASKELKADTTILLNAVAQSWQAARYVPEEMRACVRGHAVELQGLHYGFMAFLNAAQGPSNAQGPSATSAALTNSAASAGFVDPAPSRSAVGSVEGLLRLIAEFVGAPVGTEWRILRDAAVNLE